MPIQRIYRHDIKCIWLSDGSRLEAPTVANGITKNYYLVPQVIHARRLRGRSPASPHRRVFQWGTCVTTILTARTAMTRTVTYVLQVSDVVMVTIYIVGRQCNGDVCTAGKRRCQGYYIYSRETV